MISEATVVSASSTLDEETDRSFELVLRAARVVSTLDEEFESSRLEV
jgi:hypothetical protein